MTIDNSGSVPKKYYRLADLAKRWNLEVSELLNYAIEGVLHVAIEEFHGADCNDGDGEANGGRTVAYPCWAVFLVPDALKKIAVYGEASIAGGLRMTSCGFQPTFFPQRRLTADDLIVLPQLLEGIATQLDAGTDSVGSSMSFASRKTLLKQIAALAVLLSKQHEKFAWGKKPNSKGIAEAIEQAIANWPADTSGKLEQDFFSKSKINDSIREGLELIGFKENMPTP